MPSNTPVPDKAAGDIFSESMWDLYIKENINKLLDRGHRVLTVAQFAALASPEGTKGTVAPDEVYLEVDSANGVLWHLAYESGEATYKWRFLGGPPLAAFGAGLPIDVTLPRAGDYDVHATASSASFGSGVSATFITKIQNPAATDKQTMQEYIPGTADDERATTAHYYRVAGCAASSVMRLASAGTASAAVASIAVTPTRIS